LVALRATKKTHELSKKENIVTPNWLELLSEWNWEPSVLLGIAALGGAYLVFSGPLRSRFASSRPVSRSQATWFAGAMLVLFMALVSPLDNWGDTYLQSAHMFQHMLLTLAVPPMLILGTPHWMVRALVNRPFWLRAGRVLTHPALAYGLFNLVFMVWHLPVLYEAALNNEAIHIVEHLCFLVTGVITWWPIFSMTPELPPISPGFQILYLFLQGIPTTVLTALIVFAPDVLYPTYLAAPRVFGIDAMMDQQIAGLEMGSLGMVVYLFILTIVFYRWMNREASQERSRAL
jgi:putative membrane protein